MKWKLYIKETLESKGHKVKIDYESNDIIINDSLLAHIKVSPYYYGKRSQLHTFNLRNIPNECNILICIGMDEDENVKRCLIIPRDYFGDKKNISCGVFSRHDYYNNNWELIEFMK